MNAISILRDPFARGNVVRQTVPKADRGECAWCGQPARFRYGWDDDQGPRHSHIGKRQFCSRKLRALLQLLALLELLTTTFTRRSAGV